MHPAQILSALLLLFLCSCTSVESRVTRFHSLPPKGAGQTFMVIATGKQTPLETSVYAARISAALIKYGWKPLVSGVPDYIVGFDYKMLGSGEFQGVREIIGMTSSGTTTRHSGTVSSYGSSGSYSGTSYTPATYGVVGLAPYTYRLYKRGLIVVIGTAQGPVFQGDAMSVGKTSTIEAVLPQMIDAIFTRFPGKSGSVVEISKPS